MNRIIKWLFALAFVGPLLGCSIIGLGKEPSADRYFWGYWTRMDTGDVYLITDKIVRIGNRSEYSISSASETTLKFDTSTIQKISQNVASVGANALLFRDGGSDRSFTTRLAGFSDGAARVLEARGLGIGSQPIAGRPGTRTNAENASDTQTISSAADGMLQFSGAVANSPQKISINTAGTKAQPVIVTVQPSFNGEFVGTIPVVESGYSFKVTSKILDSSNGYQYANNYASYWLSIMINNIGNADCLTSVYEVESQDPNLRFISAGSSYYIPGQGSVQRSSLTGNLSSIEPGKSKPLYFVVEYGHLANEYVDAILKISITDSGLNPRTWEDYAVIRFYRRPVALSVASSNLDGNSSSKLKGFLMHPDGKSQYFTVDNNGKATVVMPWSSQPYGLVFSGAGAETEMKYSFALGSTTANLSGTWSIADINSYEPNDNEWMKTVVVDPQTARKSYLKKGDIDFYHIDVSGTPGDFQPIVFNAYQLSDSAAGGNGDNQPNPGETLYMDMRIQNISQSTKNVTATLSSPSSYITISKPSYSYGDIPGGRYDTAYSGSSSYPDVSMSPSSNYFVFTLAANTPIGTVVPVNIAFSDTLGNTWTDGFTLVVVKTGAIIRYNAVSIASSGTPRGMDMRIQNSGTSKALGLTATLSSASSYITFSKPSYLYGDIPAGYYRTAYWGTSSSPTVGMSPSTSYFAFSIVNSPPAGTIIPVSILFSDSQGNSWTDSFNITIN